MKLPYKIGDKIVCKKSFRSVFLGTLFEFVVGESYEVIYCNYYWEHTKDVVALAVRYKNDTNSQTFYDVEEEFMDGAGLKTANLTKIFDYFYTPAEIRKLKLQKLGTTI